MSWKDVEDQAKVIMEKDEFMHDIMKRGIIDHDGFSSAITSMLADQFATERVNSSRWRGLFACAYEKDVLYEDNMGPADEMGMLDLIAVSERDPASDGLVTPFLYFKGFKAIQTHRMAHVLWRLGRKDAARAIQSRCADLFSVDIHPAAVIGNI